MNQYDLYEGIGRVDGDLLARTEQKPRKRRWTGAVAALLALGVLGGAVLLPGSNPLAARAEALYSPAYPAMAPYPADYTAPDFDEQYQAWNRDIQAQRRDPSYAQGMQPFLTAGIRQFLTGSEAENRAFSPLNVYLALGMLAEITDGSSRQQILDLLGPADLPALRRQASDLWNANYRADGASASLLASSLWMDRAVDFRPEPLQTLADTYYASSYRGKMGSPELDRLLQSWLNDNTGGLLQQQAADLHLSPDSLMALAATLFYQARWQDSFDPADTAPGVFHGASGDRDCDFMHSSQPDLYYWGEGFSAVGRRMDAQNGVMWFILPDEGVTPDQLLAGSSVMDFMLAGSRWPDSKQLMVHLSVPKFDLTSQLELTEGLKALGVTDVFDPAVSDFSPLLPDARRAALGQVQHDVRVAVDEQGVTAAAYTVARLDGAMLLPAEEVDFRLDRPFLFAITGAGGLPLFAGVVNTVG